MSDADTRGTPSAPDGLEATSGFLERIPQPLEDPVPERVGAFRIVRVLGQGGMGTVYEAEQESTRRFVALKVIHPHLATPRYRRRFAEEIRALGRFDHPGIARILEAGSSPDDQGAMRLYFAMELVAGLRLDRHAASQRLTPTQIATLMAQVADAVHHAHQKGVIHCDLKPANILVSTDGVPKVLDFGIARALTEGGEELTARTSPTELAAVMGTLAYASPEQATGDRNRIDALTDVFGLGAVLHSLVAGAPPHDVTGRIVAEAVHEVLTRPPRRLRAIVPSCPADLETVVSKAMSSAPAARYASAAAFAADLRLFLEGRPITARPVSALERVVKWARRRRRAAAAIAAVALLAVAAAGIVVKAVMDRNTASLQAIAQERDHAESLRAIRGAQRIVGSRHLRSGSFAEHLHPEEAVIPGGTVVAALPWAPATAAARSGSAMLLLDGDGGIVATLDAPRRWPAWAAPRFDPDGTFRDRIDAPQRALTIAATLRDAPDHAGRDLIRSVRVMDDQLHMGVLEVEPLSSVLQARGGVTDATRQWWRRGDVREVAWDESRRMVWAVVNEEMLQAYAPELIGWDSAGCPVGLDQPRILLALPLEAGAPMRAVMPPLQGDAAHPPVPVRWAFCTRAPARMRGPVAGAAGATGAAGAVEEPPTSPEASPEQQGGVTRLHAQAFEPFPADERRGLGRLILAATRADLATDSTLAVVIDGQGEPAAAFEVLATGDRDADARAARLAAQLDPRREVVRLALDAVTAEAAAAEAMVRTAPALATAPDADALASGALRAMRANWRWLLASGWELLEESAALNAAEGAATDAGVSAARLAAERFERAAALHAQRCPGVAHGGCQCEWFLASGEAVAHAAALQWSDAAAAARRAIQLHTAFPNLGAGDPLNPAILALALHEAGDAEGAAEALGAAEAEERVRQAATGRPRQGAVERVTDAMLRRARAALAP